MSDIIDDEHWMKTDTSKVIALSNGEEVGLTMSNWHWSALDWMEQKLSIKPDTIIARAREIGEGHGLDHDVKEYVEGFINAYDAEARSA